MMIKQLLEMGTLVMTPGVESGVAIPHGIRPIVQVLIRHCTGDWGDVCDEDKVLNNHAAEHGNRILSSYTIEDTKVWVITESDRSVTTVLLPEEY